MAKINTEKQKDVKGTREERFNVAKENEQKRGEKKSHQ